ncbi:hypothetical protein J1614_001077 [Plenodomus biglobosus]|nr:hypothetical protein J1614_001077 [Plenodomus biglobosus]
MFPVALRLCTNSRHIIRPRTTITLQRAFNAAYSPLSAPATMDKAPTASNPSKSDSILNWADQKTGEFKRQTSVFRNWIQNKPDAEFPAEANRYHLYVSYACPWAHRTLIVRALKGLQDIIPYTSVHWHMGEKGWRFATAAEVRDHTAPPGNTTPDPHHDGFSHIRDIYFEQDPEYKGRFTVPTLYDVKARRIVSNESAEIIRMMYSEFDDLIGEEYKGIELLPGGLKGEIEEMNGWVYEGVNNGVYRAGFATYVLLFFSFLSHSFLIHPIPHTNPLSPPPPDPKTPTPKQ